MPPTKKTSLDIENVKNSPLMMEFRRESEQCLLTHSRLLWVTLEGAAVYKMQALMRDKLRNHKMIKEWKMYFLHVCLKLANQEVLGLIMMALNMLRRQVVLKERPRVTLIMQNKAMHLKSFRMFSTSNRPVDIKKQCSEQFHYVDKGQVIDDQDSWLRSVIQK